MFVAITPGNTPFAYRASTSTDPAPMISPAFVEANYEILESLLRNRLRQIHNEDLRTKLEYFSEDYDEELEMEPRLERTKEVTPPLRTRSPRVRRQRERVVGFEEALNRERSRIGKNIEGNGPSEARAEENGRREMNLPPLLAANLGRNEDGQPLGSSLTFILGLHEDQRIFGFVHGLKARNLVEHLSTNLPSTYKGDREVETGSPLTGDLITDCSPACLKDQERSSPQKSSQKLRAASSYVGKQTIARHVQVLLFSRRPWARH
ncbi:hypothetical protein Tco_0649135 [Tanacetum coccineum]